MKTSLEKFKEIHDTEITTLFENAREKLDQIYVQANDSKRQIIRELAKSLEGKIQLDTICIEITNRLGGRVSKSFIRENLEEKYKQPVRVENAKKQKPKPQKDLSLAPVVALNQEKELEEEAEQETVEKDDTIVDASDKISIEDKDKLPTTIDFSAISPVSHQQGGQQSKNQANCDVEEMGDVEEKSNENRELKESPEKSSPLITTDKRVSVVSENKNDILQFEFSMPSENIRKHMALRRQEIDDDGRVWFNGKIDKKTREVISPSIGRIEQQQQGES